MCSLQSNCKQKRIQLFYKTYNWFLCFLFQFGFPDSSMFKKFQLLSFPYFLDNELSQLSLVSYGSYHLYLSFSFFLCCQAVCFVLALLQAQQNWVCSTVDRFIKNEGSSFYVATDSSVSLACRGTGWWNFPRVVSFSIYENQQVPADLKMCCLSCLVFNCVFSFFIK